MTNVHIEFDEGFVDAVIQDAEKAGKPLSEKDVKFLKAIEEANKHGVTDFPCDSPEKAELISKKVGKIMVDNVANFSEATKRDFADTVSKNLEEHGKFVDGAKEALDSFRENATKEFDSFKGNAMDDFDSFRESMMEGFGNTGAHAGGMQGASDFINAGFEDKKETKAVLKEQRVEHDKSVAKATEAALSGEWKVYEAEPPLKSPLEQGEKPKEQPNYYKDNGMKIIEPSELQMETHETGLSEQPNYREDVAKANGFRVIEPSELQVEKPETKGLPESAIYAPGHEPQAKAAQQESATAGNKQMPLWMMQQKGYGR